MTRDDPLLDTEPLSVVVVTYNSASVITGLLDSLATGLDGVPSWEVVVVDNDSTDGTPELVERTCADALVVRMGCNAGYAAGINAGVAAATLDGAVLVLNPDVRLRAGCGHHLLSALAEPSVGIAAPQLRDAHDVVALSLRRDPSVASAWAEAILGGTVAGRHGAGEVLTDQSSYSAARDVDWATGAVLAISRACRSAVGAWDETFFLYSEEVDYCQRARAAGYRVRYEPRAVAEHVGGPYGADARLWAHLVRNRVRHYGRHHGPTRTAAFTAGVALGEVLRLPVRASARAGVRAAVTARRRADARPEEPGFVWFVAQDWWYHNQAHSDFQLMREVALDRPVLVVNSLGLRLPRKGVSTQPWRRIARKARSMTKLVRRPLPELPRFHVMTPLFLPFYGETAGARFSAWLVRRQVALVARWIGAGRHPYVGVTIPTAWPVVRRMGRSALLFNRSDLHSAFPEADGSWVAGLERALLADSDRVLYVSHELMALDRAVVGDRGVFLDHGVDLARFTWDPRSRDEPEMAGIPRPRMGFFGGIDDYVVDLKLLVETARGVPEAQLVLIGDATCDLDELTSLPNVHWLGHRPYEQIPALGRGFDVALMPWLDNEWIRFANPVKLKEYLALGLPVVTTEYPEVDSYRDRIAVARDRAEFVDRVRAALAEPGDPRLRRSSVLDCAWSTRARVLVDIATSVRAR
ncbi:glycosyltransferase [uncultured Cellulomonas sp.]|uniref:glycosyltransferase n=1 Tax=uncultured Cellulomonas sp. TaxID=189682 RepID=UPI00262000B1|nr:glycosyltransferase [uncultured Cellulomonas sp.]